MAAVDVESLTVRYGTVTAVDDLTFRAEAGRVTCVLGPNGAGKTSTIEALEGVRRPAAGRLSVVGLDPVADHAALTTRIGVMLQEGGIHPAVRVGEALRHAAALYPESLDPGELIDQLGLAGLESRPYRQLSGGEQRRLALALALVGRPQVAFLDEPTAGVDPAGRQVIRQVVADLRNEGVTVLLTTHDLDEAERVADHVVIVVDGRLVAEGSVEALTRTPEGEQHVRFRAPAGLDRRSLALHLGGAEVTEAGPGEYSVAAAPTPGTVAAITAWLAEHDLPLADLRAGRQRLEDVYLRLTATPRPARPDRAPVGGTEAPTGPSPDTGSSAAGARTPAPGSTSADAPAAAPSAAPAERAPGPAPATRAEEDDGPGEPAAAERSPRGEPIAEGPGGPPAPGPGPSPPGDASETDRRASPPGTDRDDDRGGS